MAVDQLSVVEPYRTARPGILPSSSSRERERTYAPHASAKSRKRKRERNPHLEPHDLPVALATERAGV
jgi:hypothetical protein